MMMFLLFFISIFLGLSEGYEKAVLSIDGGGVRGIIPAVMLQRLEQALQDESNDTNARVVDYFDVVAGTSTGGLITLMLTAPNGSTNRPLFTAKGVVDFYKTQSQLIFSQTSLSRTRKTSEQDVNKLFPYLVANSGRFPLIQLLIEWLEQLTWLGAFEFVQDLLDGIFGGAKYPPGNLEDILQQNLNNLKLNQTLKPIVISSFDITANKPAMFKTSQATKDGTKNAFLRDIGRATSAAPTYFPPKSFNVDGEQYNLVDGGLAANNPALVGLIEAESLKNGNSSSSSFRATISDNNLVLSLGCGKAAESFSTSSVDDWNPLSWMMRVENDELKTPLVSMLMDAHSEMVERSLSLIFSDEAKRSNYLRIQATLSDNLTALDDGSPDHMNALELYAQQLLQEPMTVLNVLTGEYVPGTITNEQAIVNLAKTLVSDE